MNDLINKFIQGNSKEKLKLIPDKSIRCCVTSPPYFGLRDYGTATWHGGDEFCDHKGKPFRTKENVNKNTGTGDDIKNKEDYQPFKSICDKCSAQRIDEQIGLEETPEQYIASLVEVFEEVKRALADDGTLWVNIGDSYAGSTRGLGDTREDKGKSGTNKGRIGVNSNNFSNYGLKPKDLIGIPWMLAFALRSAGWYLRQDIIWHKPNPMPESVTDRCTKAHEYIFLLSKSKMYYYDCEAIKIESIYSDDASRGESRKRNPTKKINGMRSPGTYEMSNKRSIWTCCTKAYAEAHFATFPAELIVDCIKAGSAEGDIILDPFSGAGTTAMVAQKLNRNFIAIELNQKYIDIAERRLDKELGMFRKH